MLNKSRESLIAGQIAGGAFLAWVIGLGITLFSVARGRENAGVVVDQRLLMYEVGGVFLAVVAFVVLLVAGSCLEIERRRRSG